MLQIGKDNKKTVSKILGQPTFSGTLGDNSFYYVGTVNSKVAFLYPSVHEQYVLELNFDKKDKSKLQKLLKKNKGKFPFNPPGEPVVNWSLDDRGSKGIEWSGIPKSKYDKAVEFFMKNKLNPRG